MQKTNNPNINSKNYWNSVYGSEEERAVYAAQGTDKGSIELSDHNHASSVKTERFNTAIKFITDGDKVIDIGCGVGVFTNLVKKTYPECDVTGMDISDKAIEANKLENDQIKYFQGYIGRLQVPEDYYDVVFCGETIEHLDEPQVLFNEAYKMLREGGKLIITTPREDRINSEEHLWFFEQEDVEELFIKAGFKEIKFEYLKDMEHLLIIFGVGTK